MPRRRCGRRSYDPLGPQLVELARRSSRAGRRRRARCRRPAPERPDQLQPARESRTASARCRASCTGRSPRPSASRSMSRAANCGSSKMSAIVATTPAGTPASPRTRVDLDGVARARPVGDEPLDLRPGSPREPRASRSARRRPARAGPSWSTSRRKTLSTLAEMITQRPSPLRNRLDGTMPARPVPDGPRALPDRSYSGTTLSSIAKHASVSATSTTCPRPLPARVPPDQREQHPLEREHRRERVAERDAEPRRRPVGEAVQVTQAADRLGHRCEAGPVRARPGLAIARHPREDRRRGLTSASTS